MKAGVYCIFFLLIISFQSSLFNPLAIVGIKPDLAFSFLYIIGLLTGPVEATLAGMGTGLLIDIGSSSFLGVTGISRGLLGLSAGLLGEKVLDITSPSNGIFITAFSLLEGVVFLFFLQIVYSDLPFLNLVIERILPQAIYTGILGIILLRLITEKKILPVLTRRAAQKEL